MIRQLKNFLTDLIFPRRCIGCKTIDTWFCDDCFSLIVPNREQYCYICRKLSSSGETCRSHFTDSNRSRLLDRVLIAAHYEANPLLKKAIHALKYFRHPEDIAEKLGSLLTEILLNQINDPERNFTIVPVPLHRNRQRERGFNQAELLAKQLHHPRRTNSACPPWRELLTRVRPTLPQVKTRSRKNRLQNLQGAFSIKGKVDPTTTYILIDDVIATGTTLEECCKVLKENGAKKVWGLVLARN